MNSKLEKWINKLSFGEDKVYENLCIIPFLSNTDEKLKLLTLAKAMQNNFVLVEELEDGARASEIRLINKSKHYVLILDGEQLIGAKQNRIVNKTIIVPPAPETIIPASCTEQGRWHFVSKKFDKSRYSAPSTIRRMFKKKKNAQAEVWKNVEERLFSFKVSSATSSLEHAYTEINPKLETYKNVCSQLPSQIGFMVFINGEFAGLDIVGDTDLFSELYSGMISGYIMDAMYERKNKIKSEISEEDKNDILEDLLKSKTKKGKSIGVEKRKMSKGKKTAGEFVDFKKMPVHLAAFPK